MPMAIRCRLIGRARWLSRLDERGCGRVGLYIVVGEESIFQAGRATV
jgi:hypothetical protein